MSAEALAEALACAPRRRLASAFEVPVDFTVPLAREVEAERCHEEWLTAHPDCRLDDVDAVDDELAE